MRVTQIIEISKSRSKVYLDEEFAFVLYKGELRQYHLQEGKEISDKDYRTILQEVLPKRVKLRCMNLLKARSYTVQQLRTKLRQDFYTEEMIEVGIQYVSSYHYLDDLRYASDYIMSYEGAKSRRQIEQNLLQKGIDKETMHRAWAEWEARGGSQDEKAMIIRQLEKKHYDPETSDFKEKQKLFAFLMRKGFTPSLISQVLRLEGWES